MTSGTAGAVAARDQGGDYQARLFWLEALRMLDPHPRVARVGIEQSEYTHFDDVVVIYNDGHGLDYDIECHQAKFHVRPDGSLSWESMMSPAWMNVKKMSLMQRLVAADRQHKGRAALYLTTPWSFHPEDALAKMVSNVDDEFIVSALFDDKLKSDAAKMRAALIEHIGCDEAELRSAVSRWRIRNDSSLVRLQRRLDDRLARFRFKTVGDRQINVYDELARKLIQAKTGPLDAAQLRVLFEKEELLENVEAPVAEPWRVGIRSFKRQATYLEEEMDELLDLLDLFDDRYLRDGLTWSNDVGPRVDDFVSSLDDDRRSDVELHLHCKLSIAYAAGGAVSRKSSTRYSFRQTGPRGVEIWRLTEGAGATADDTWMVEDIRLREDAPDVAVAVAVSSDSGADARTYIENRIPSVGRLLVLRPVGGSGQRAVRDGAHAFDLGETFAEIVNRERTSEQRRQLLHVLPAVPATVAFTMGRAGSRLGPTQLYEFALERNDPEGYSPSILLNTA